MRRIEITVLDIDFLYTLGNIIQILSQIIGRIKRWRRRYTDNSLYRHQSSIHHALKTFRYPLHIDRFKSHYWRLVEWTDIGGRQIRNTSITINRYRWVLMSTKLCLIIMEMFILREIQLQHNPSLMNITVLISSLKSQNQEKIRAPYLICLFGVISLPF